MGKVQRWTIITALLLTQAGGYSSFAGQPARQTLAKAETARRILVCFGDSLTAGYGAEAGHSYPDYLQKDLNQLHFGYRVVNQGVSGDTTKDGVNRLNAVLALHAPVAVVEFGGNDGLRGLPISETRANLDRIVRTLQQAGTSVVLAGITLPPQYGTDYVDQFNKMYVDIAKKYKVPLLPFLLQGAYGGRGMIQADGIHPTAKGNEIVARNVLNLLKPVLKK